MYIVREWLAILVLIFILAGLSFLASCGVLILQEGAGFLVISLRKIVERAGRVPAKTFGPDKPKVMDAGL